MTKRFVLGFTGTQTGMTPAQQATFRKLITRLAPDEFRHGDCVGSDAEAHYIVRELNLSIKIVGHPPINRTKRALCQFDEALPVEDYLPRNRKIVASSDELFATPENYVPKIRSGTWTTVRYANAANKPVTVIWPDGSFTKNFVV